MEQRTVRIVSVSSSSCKVLKNEALAAEANEDGSWWSAEESRVIKVPMTRIPIFRLLGNNGVGREKEKREREGKK